MTRSKALLLAPFVSFVAIMAYLSILKAIGDPRAQDLRLDEHEMNVVEDIWLIATLVGVLSVWFRTIWRAYHAGLRGWATAVFFVWPAAVLYIWKYE